MKADTPFTTSNNSQHSFESFFPAQIISASTFQYFLFCLVTCLTKKPESGYNKMKWGMKTETNNLCHILFLEMIGPSYKF